MQSAAPSKLAGRGPPVVWRPRKLAKRPQRRHGVGHVRPPGRDVTVATQPHAQEPVRFRARFLEALKAGRVALYAFQAGRDFSGLCPQWQVVQALTSVTGSTSCATSPCEPTSRGCASSGAMACSYVRVDSRPPAMLALTADVDQTCLIKHTSACWWPRVRTGLCRAKIHRAESVIGGKTAGRFCATSLP
jgi:hypothetical protein